MHYVTVKIRSSSNNKQCLLPKSRGDKTQGTPPLQKVGGTCPPVHPRIYAHDEHHTYLLRWSLCWRRNETSCCWAWCDWCWHHIFNFDFLTGATYVCATACLVLYWSISKATGAVRVLFCQWFLSSFNGEIDIVLGHHRARSVCHHSIWVDCLICSTCNVIFSTSSSSSSPSQMDPVPIVIWCFFGNLVSK